MDNRPIGLLDSGVGGLTVAREVLHQLPNEEIIYIGDSARTPYGPRSSEEILRFTWEMVHFLLSKNVKMIVMACNTATAVALDDIRRQLDIPVLGVIESGAKAAADSKSKSLGLIATEATVKSQSYDKELQALSADRNLVSLACPEFVTFVEADQITEPSTQEVVTEKLQPLKGRIDTLILGCTHFPLLRRQIQSAIGDDVQLIDAGQMMVAELSALIEQQSLSAETGNIPQHQFYSTGNITLFQKIAETWLNRKIKVQKAELYPSTLLIATRNKGKIREFQSLFAPLGYEVKSLLDYKSLPEIEETGSTFEENARLKAETVSALTGQIVIGDDSGLCVDALDGRPGIYSHRFAGENPTDEENNTKLLAELAKVALTADKRRAHFHTTLVASRAHHDSLVVEADWQGHIAEQPQGNDGFGYDPLFLVGETDRSAAELSMEEKNQLSHRGQALRKLLLALPAWLQENQERSHQ